MADSIAVVTGAGGGIGGASAHALAATHDVVLCVDRDLHRATQTAVGIRTAGRRAAAMEADAAEADFGERVAREAGRLGRVRSVVHAVAHEEHLPAAEVSRESVLRSLTVGPLAAFELFRACAAQPDITQPDASEPVAAKTSAPDTTAPATSAAGTEAGTQTGTEAGTETGTESGPRASYIAIGSLHERYPFANCLGYNAAHGALGQVVRTLAHEWAGRRIRVNAVVPGWIATPGEEVLHGAERIARAGAALPFGALGSPAQVAAAVAFLASDAADYVSGSFLTVDGALSVALARLPGLDA